MGVNQSYQGQPIQLEPIKPVRQLVKPEPVQAGLVLLEPVQVLPDRLSEMLHW